MSRVERHTAEEAAKKGRRSHKKTESQGQDQIQDRPVEKVDYAIEDMLQADAGFAVDTGNNQEGYRMGRAARNAEVNRAKDSKKPDKTEKRKRKGRVTPFGRFLNFIGTIIMLAGILVCLGLAAPRLAGLQSFVVVSGSMEPEIPVGSMIYSKEVDPATIKRGDIIVFYGTNPDVSNTDNTPITHRVVENNAETQEITTKGDANEHNDMNPVLYDHVIGLVVKHIPKLGFAASPIAKPLGKAAMVMIIVAGWLLAEVGSHIRKRL